MKLKDLGEFGFIDRIAERVAPAADVPLGIGDDAAALIPAAGEHTLVTSDLLAEGIHFDRAFTDPYRLGRKSLSVNLSDIAAMGGRPRHALLSLAVPKDIDLAFLDDFTKGFLAVADEHNVILVGGDTCAARTDFVVSVTLFGAQSPEKIVTRKGARPGDLICVTGHLGDSSFGLEELRRGTVHGPAVERHLNPAARVDAGLLLAERQIPTAMIDVSDGLAADLGHIAEQSSVGAIIRTAELPLSPHILTKAAAVGKDAVTLALSGGEDYELLFTIPADAAGLLPEVAAALSLPITVIGTIIDGSGVVALDAAGNPFVPQRCGFDHFSQSS